MVAIVATVLVCTAIHSAKYDLNLAGRNWRVDQGGEETVRVVRVRTPDIYPTKRLMVRASGVIAVIDGVHNNNWDGIWRGRRGLRSSKAGDPSLECLNIFLSEKCAAADHAFILGEQRKSKMGVSLHKVQDLFYLNDDIPIFPGSHKRYNGILHENICCSAVSRISQYIAVSDMNAVWSPN